MACICGSECVDSLCGAYPPKPVPNANGYLVAISGIGAPGPAGPAGPAGEPGADSTVPGPPGPAGERGERGEPGPVGPQGIQGAVGATGPAGAQGIPGQKGDTGATGATGATGPAGARGPVGPTGATGPAGPAGAPGGVGPQGEPGKPGATGAAGPAGPIGPAGPAGSVGPAGPPGADSTVPGPAGPPGADSTVPGPVGPQGEPGADSTVPGPVGPPGADSTVPGPVGPAGADGVDGVSISIQGAVPDYSSLPADAVAGDCFVVESDGLLYDFDGTGYPPEGSGVPWRGPAGLQGQPGIQGPAGLGISYKATVATEADLPATAENGDLYVVSEPAPAHGFVWDAATSAWVDAGPVQGPQGVPGPQGESITGPPGRDGADGAPGPAGPSAVSKDVGNTSVLGTDGLIFTPAAPAATGFLPLTGGTMTGTITVPSGSIGMAVNGTSYNMLGGSGGVAFRSGTSNIINHTSAEIAAFVPITTSGGAVGVRFGSGGPSLAKSGTSIASSAPITVAAAPTSGTELANKAYVDAVAAGGGGTEYVLPVSTATVLGGVKVGAGLAVTADGVLSSAVAGNYVNKSGDVMNGPLRWSNSGGVSTYNGQDVYVYYDGTYFRSYMPSGRQGWIVEAATGQVLFPGAVPSCNFSPTETGHLTNKAYVDAAVSGSTAYLKTTGGTMTGTITVPTTVPALTFGTSGYNVFGASGGLAVRSNNTNITNFTASEVVAYVPITTAGSGVGVRFGSGGPSLSRSGTAIASSGPITVAAAPATPNELANKVYVDSAIATAGVSNPVAGSVAGLTLWTGSQAAYDGIATKDPKTVYVVV